MTWMVVAIIAAFFYIMIGAFFASIFCLAGPTLTGLQKFGSSVFILTLWPVIILSMLFVMLMETIFGRDK